MSLVFSARRLRRSHPPCRPLITALALGAAGLVGCEVAEAFASLWGADVTLIDISLDRLRYLDELWGNRMRTLFSNRQNIEQAVIGADLVIGHHPHVLQGIETYRGRLIFYSLGNFTFVS